MLISGVDDMLHFGILLSLIVRWAVSRFPYSGASKPPMYGDYEAQRHWMEITVNLPLQEWYKNSTNNDLQYWGLDYPPLTAYHSMLCGYVARWINSDWVALNSSRGYEGYYHKIFMRSTVLAADILFYLPIIFYWITIRQPHNLRDKAILISLCLLYPGLILIDHGHFQYNCVSLGFAATAVLFLMWRYDLVGAAFFTFALNYKQMSLYYALPFFCYLLGRCFQLPPKEGMKKFFHLSLVVLYSTAMCWLPFLTSLESTSAVVQRIFPLDRGIYEDKVANFWYMLSVLVKLKEIFPSSKLAVISGLSTLIAVLPSSVDLLKNPNLHKFRIALVNSSLSFFLFSYQVHEKSILFPALPVLLLFEDHPLLCTWFAYISTFSLVPLIAKDGLIVPFVALSVFFLIGAIRAYEDLLISFKSQKSTIASLSFLVSIFGSAVLVFAMYTVKQPARYPHLHILLNCVYSGVHFIGFLLYFNYLQFTEKPYDLYYSKIRDYKYD